MTLNTPLVSVCIPAFNSETYISQTLNCLLDQTYQNLEIIVVDDGSTDGTLPIVKGISDLRLKCASQRHNGAAAARNKAYSLCTGDFIKFMDADDLLNRECIQIQLLKIIQKPNCIASAKWGRFYADDASDFRVAPEEIYKDLPGIDWLVNSQIHSGANMMQPGIFLLPRNIIDKSGGWNEELSLIDDFEYMVRVLTKSEYVLFCDEAVLMYRSGLQNSLSQKKTGKHMQSAFQSLRLGIERMLETRNDSRTRLACANIYQKWAYLFYPHYPVFCNTAEQKIMELGGSDINIGGGRLYILLAKLIGWKKAKKLKMMLTGDT